MCVWCMTDALFWLQILGAYHEVEYSSIVGQKETYFTCLHHCNVLIFYRIGINLKLYDIKCMFVYILLTNASFAFRIVILIFFHVCISYCMFVENTFTHQATILLGSCYHV